MMEFKEEEEGEPPDYEERRSRQRYYRAAGDKWVTRDIAALQFLGGIPLAAEAAIVKEGWSRQESEQMENIAEPPTSSKGKWWEKWVKPTNGIPKDVMQQQSGPKEAAALEEPTREELGKHPIAAPAAATAYAPGRRLEGDDAVRIQIPLTTDSRTRQKSLARAAELREWEKQTALGFHHPPLLAGRMFFSAAGSYPAAVFSIKRYEPKREEAAITRKKLEAIGGGGSTFEVPARDWRGVSYRALLRRRGVEEDSKTFNRFVRHEDGDANSDSATVSSNSSEDSLAYVPGILDDPEMVLGRHRTVLIGDRVTGPMVVSTIQFVKPAILKAELNKQFRERFDGWEPPRSARKYIGARVVEGNYVLMDPAEEEPRVRQGSVASAGSASEGRTEKTLRIPPSLTLSKIRSLKQQALAAAVQAQLEVGTVALACVYFERLCLDCRVDKSNRRLAFAACLLLAIKLNEPHVGLVMKPDEQVNMEAVNATTTTRLQSWIRPNKRSNTVFASLLEFFLQDWSLSLQKLFHAEWGVFAALGFSLHATPSQVAFHFRRLMKTLEWNPREYLGREMYQHWQQALAEEDERRKDKERRRELKRQKQQDRILNLQIEIENEMLRRKNEKKDYNREEEPESVPNSPKPKSSTRMGVNLLHRFGMRRSQSHQKFPAKASTEHGGSRRSKGLGLALSPSMPVISTTDPDSGTVAIDIPISDGHVVSDEISLGSFHDVEHEGIIV